MDGTVVGVLRSSARGFFWYLESEIKAMCYDDDGVGFAGRLELCLAQGLFGSARLDINMTLSDCSH